MMMNGFGFTGGFQSNNMPMMGGYGFGGGGGGGMQPQMQQFGNSQQQTYQQQQQQRQNCSNSSETLNNRHINDSTTTTIRRLQIAGRNTGRNNGTTESYNNTGSRSESYNNYRSESCRLVVLNLTIILRRLVLTIMIGRRSESYNNSGPRRSPPAGRGRAMTTPAWMKDLKIVYLIFFFFLLLVFSTWH